MALLPYLWRAYRVFEKFSLTRFVTLFPIQWFDAFIVFSHTSNHEHFNFNSLLSFCFFSFSPKIWCKKERGGGWKRWLWLTAGNWRRAGGWKGVGRRIITKLNEQQTEGAIKPRIGFLSRWNKGNVEGRGGATRRRFSPIS